MIGLEYIMAGYFHLASTKQDYKCTLDQSPVFNIVATGMEYVVDHTKSVKDLTAATVNIETPYGPDAKTFTDGLMRGSIQTQLEFEWGISHYPTRKNTTCLAVKKINVRIHIDPTVFIAREYKKGSCLYNAIMEHEMKHIHVDRVVVNKYTAIIGRALDNTFKKIGYVHGPVEDSQRDALSTQITGIIQGIVKGYTDNMNVERDRMQAAIDTVEEYTRVSKMCPDARTGEGPVSHKHNKKKRD